MTDTTTLTNRVILAIDEEFPARVWRRNVGSGYPLTNVQAAISALKRGDAHAALNHLTRCRPVSFGQAGEPDVDGILGPNGRRIGVEIKNEATNDRMREAQIICRRVYEAHGAIYIVGTSPQQVVEELRKRI